MSNSNPLPGIGGIIALIILLSALFTRKSCDLGCTLPSPSSNSRPRQLEELTKDEKRAGFEQMLNDPEKGQLFLSVLLNDQRFQEFLERIKPDAETIEVLEELRKQHQFKSEVPENVSVTVTQVGEVPKFIPAKFKKIRANANELDTTISQ